VNGILLTTATNDLPLTLGVHKLGWFIQLFFFKKKKNLHKRFQIPEIHTDLRSLTFDWRDLQGRWYCGTCSGSM